MGIAASIDDISNTNSLDGWKCTTITPASWNTINFNDSSYYKLLLLVIIMIQLKIMISLVLNRSGPVG